jgi:hypothetical protein
MRAAAVPAPTTGTTRKREPTQQRLKHEWTGKVEVPEVEAEHATPAGRPQPRGHTPWLALGAVGIVVIGGIVAFAVTRGGTQASDAQPAGSATTASGSAPAAPPAPPPAPPPELPAPLPAVAKLALDSTPRGATVTDVTTGKVVGTTPVPYSLPGSKTPRLLAFRLAGYVDTTLEVVPDKETFSYTATLTRGSSTGTTPPVRVVADPNRPGSNTVVSPPDSPGAVTRPETGSATKPPDTRPEARPPTHPEPKPDDCGDGSEPCLKRNIPGLGGNGAPAGAPAAPPAGAPASP